MMEFKKQLITPSIAKELLESNVSNRRVKMPVLQRYTKDILNGRWKEDTGEVIKISKEGKILDGQHRLMAVVKANIAVHFHIAYNLESDVFSVLDTGSIRNASDAFQVEGISNQAQIPSIISAYDLAKKGFRIIGNSKHVKLTSQELLDEYYSRESFWQNVHKKSATWYLSFARILPKSLFGGLYAFLLEKNELDAQSFMDQLATGVGITNNAILLLRQKLIQDKMSIRKMNYNLRQALIIKTWNYFRRNETNIKILKISIEIEGFPVAI